MSHFLDRLTFFRKNVGQFSNGHGVVTSEDRSWEDGYRKRWQHDKIVRSTHGVNCTGSCSWKIYVKGGIVTWETQQTDYPRTRPDLPNHEPRGCARGASYSWYLYSGARVKYPMIRGRLLKLWRKARKTMSPVAAWASIVEDAEKRKSYISIRGHGGFVRVNWDEVTEIVAAANAYTIKAHGPDRVIGFSPIPAMSMVSYAAGARYLSLIGGVCMSFYDWYCDLPPASPQTWGEQTDVPESADWYNAGFIIVWGSNVPQTRTPDAHFYTEVRYKGTKSAVVSPDYAEATKFADIWLNPKQGTDAALALAMGHVILREYYLERSVPYFEDYARRYTDMPLLVRLAQRDGRLVPERLLRASELEDALGETNNPEWKTVAIDEKTGELVAPLGSIGYRWGESAKWNLEEKDGHGRNTSLKLSLAGEGTEIAAVDFPYFGGRATEHFVATEHGEILTRNVPVRTISGTDGAPMKVATVYDLMMANYGLDRGFGGANIARDYDENVPFTPAWAEHITGVRRDAIITVAREFAANAEKTNGRSMIIIGAGMNHWYNMDMNYRGVINLLVFCGAIGQSGGGWSHYVGQEKLRPQTGWTPLAFGLDWSRPPRHQNSTSFFYAHTDQWRYETLTAAEILSPTAPEGDWESSFIDYNVRAERMGWLPSAPQLKVNPLSIAEKAKVAGLEPKDYVARALKSGELELSCEDPDDPANWPRNMFVWRSNLLGSSGKGHEYFLKHLLGTENGVMGKDLGAEGAVRNKEVAWHDEAPRGKLDLLVTLDFRMSTTCVYSDIVLPTATWYEKNDLNTSDMHPFIHPLSAAVDPAWEARSDWDIYKGIAEAFSRVAPEVLGVEQDVVLTPIQHDTAGEMAQPFDVKDWKRDEIEPIPGRSMPSVAVVERDYPNIHARFTALGPLMTSIGNGGKGINWQTEHEVAALAALNGVHRDGAAKGLAKIETDIDAAEVILMLAPETNGEVAVKAWEALSKATGRDHAHLALPKEDEKIRYRDIQAQPRKIISSPTWSGIESEKVCYNAGYTNVHELIPWRTLTGRQQLYQDHLWMRAFGEGLVTWKPPVDLKTIGVVKDRHPNGNKEIVLNFLTPHQKWGIHSTYTDNLLMLTLNRGGPVVWISETDAKSAGIVDNDWVEVFNANGALTARAVVSQRIKQGMVLMYHAQEKIINTPGSELTGNRGGIHNSVTRTVLKPTHMIGGYAQLAYGFNYYGTVGSNRDEFVVVRKMSKVDWLEEPLATSAQKEAAE
ncbi:MULTISPECIES: nitrate reductase subunit alpha [unclassified Rhizobium]|uniref:nitrate reductase subunit alpha n=1 Tax=unclassified Rhizobium TaxID=2613769 RepID=UPI00160B9AD9|nr:MULTISPECIES: nitrate reductase subunit alpha [unclassified Rhizobium]MBB3289096.1 nitrate reductase alpha subunit [Rhizobium sp. BK252]MBB3403838.1 nitrate reductase alpha subunit [Rhizobium sp. BK289]MBB3416493.1 nitrate reductase alpha subunit [Rhizobium sp. BK284]MBB3484301.1 nitrate reductase alpha subunit [Rhizobium sp. BK347]